MKKHQIKMNRAIETYTGFKGGATLSAITDQVPEELIERLTGKELGLVMETINAAFQKGKASTGAEMIDNNAVYINSLDKVIEWNEEGAEWERQEVKDPSTYSGKRIVPVKVKDGVLVPRFSE